MGTVTLNAYSKAYPFITNRIRASVYLESSPLAMVDSIIDTTAGHPERTWNFPGLVRANYIFRLDEINGLDQVVQNLAEFSVVPGEVEGYLTRNDEQIRVDTTPGLVSGVQTFVFDGSEVSPGVSKPDYRGWDIVPSELTGRGILVRGLDYSWDILTGAFTLLQAGDIFAPSQYYNIHFNPIQNPAGSVPQYLNDFQTVLITASSAISADMFGKKIIVEPAAPYIELSLPDIDTIAAGRKLMIEVGGSDCCVKIVPFSGDIVNFVRGNIFILPNESISIYKFIRSAGVFEWRACDADGNFKTVGTIVSEDSVPADTFNMQLLDGTIADKNQFARIYNEIVLNLPINQVVSYDQWSTGDNKYLFSLADSSNPANANKFRFPDRRGLFERATTTNKAGEYQADQVGPVTVVVPIVKGHGYTGGPNNDIFGNGYNAPQNRNITVNVNAGLETRPKNYSINKYVLI